MEGHLTINKKIVIKSPISTGSYSEFISNIMKISSKKKSSYVCVSNVHMTIEAYNDIFFLEILKKADVVTPDGMPIAKAIKYLYGIHQDRVAGMDLMPSLMDECEKSKKSIFLYGSTEEVLKKIIEKAKFSFPDLIIDSYAPPFRQLSEIEQESIINKLNEKQFDFVFVALGCPKQEKWMAEHKDKINSCMIGLGGAFEVYAEVKNRAPQWMQNMSLEWIYRLIQDPRRLWKRYLYTNTLFIILLIKQYFSIKLRGEN